MNELIVNLDITSTKKSFTTKLASKGQDHTLNNFNMHMDKTSNKKSFSTKLTLKKQLEYA